MKRTRLFLGISTIALVGFLFLWLREPDQTLGVKLGMALEIPVVVAPVSAPPDTPVANKVGRVTLIEFFAGF
jgi:hypothetical protein